MRNFFIAAHFTRGNIVIVEFSQWRERERQRGRDIERQQEVLFCIFFLVKNEIFHFPPLLSSSVHSFSTPRNSNSTQNNINSSLTVEEIKVALFIHNIESGKNCSRQTYTHTHSLASYFALKIYKFHCSWNVAVSLSLSLSLSAQQRRSDG